MTTESIEETRPAPTKPVSSALLGTAFAVLGILIGTLLAFSAQSLAQAVVAALFAFFGGSVVPLVSLKDRSSLSAIAVATFGLSAGALFGVYSGIYVNEHRLLSPIGNSTIPVAAEGAQKYLRENLLKAANDIDVKRRTNVLTLEEAYNELAKVCTK